MEEEGRRKRQKVSITGRNKATTVENEMVTIVNEDLWDQVLNIPLITDIIFDHLPLPDILSCSLASKTLVSKTREYLRRRRTLLLKCKDGISDMKKCVQFLKRYSKEFQETKFQFSGAHFALNHVVSDDNTDEPDDSDDEFPFSIVENDDEKEKCRKLMKKIFKRIEMKHLVVAYTSCYTNLMRSGVFFPLLDKCLDGKDIETVRVIGDQDIHWIKRLHKGFGNLKSIKTDAVTGCFNSYEYYLKSKYFERLFKNCPALEELRIPVNLSCLTPFETRGKLSLIKSLFVGALDPNYKIMAQKLVKLGTSLELFAFDTCHANRSANWCQDFREVVQILQPCLINTPKVAIKYEECDADAILRIDVPDLPWAKEVYVRFEFEPDDDSFAAPRIQDRLSQIFPNGRIIKVDERAEDNYYN